MFVSNSLSVHTSGTFYTDANNALFFFSLSLLQSSRLAPCDDSDSDLDDFYHVLDESSNQLKVTDHALQKKKKDTGLYLNTGRYVSIAYYYY